MKKSTFYWFVAVFGVVPVHFCMSLWVFTSDVSCSMPKSARVDQDFLAIQSALKTYKINAGRPPTTAQGLESLVNEPTTGPKPRRWSQAMRKLPLDPWETPYRYTLLAPKGTEWRSELRCAGEDRVFGSGDDIAEEEESGDSVNPVSAPAREKADARPSL